MSVNLHQKQFVDLFLKQGDKIKAYQTVYNCSKKTAQRGCQRLFQMKEFKNYFDTVTKERNILSKEDALEIMSKIARGDILWKEKVKDDVIEVRASIREAKSALDSILKWHENKDNDEESAFYDSLDKIIEAIKDDE